MANNLAEESHPHPDFPVPRLSPEQVRRFWEAVLPHRELEFWNAYRLFLNPSPDLPEEAGYTMGYWLVRSFLERTGMTALAAHQLPYDEILPNLPAS